MTIQSKSKIGLRDLIKSTLTDPNILPRLIEKRGEVFTFSAPFIKGHLFANPDYIKHIFSHKPDYVRSKQITKIVKNVLGNDGLLTVDDQQIWKKDRESLNTLFTKAKLQDYATVMTNTIAEHFEKWEPYVKTNTPILIEKYFTQMTLHNLLNTVFGGARIDTQIIPVLSREIFYLTSPITFPWVKLFGKIPMPLYFRYKKAKNHLVAIGDDIVKQSFTGDVAAKNNVIKQLSETYGYQKFEDLDVEMQQHLNSQALTFLLAGHDTTAALLVHACVFFSLYPAMADKVYAEVKEVLGSRTPTYADAEKLPFIRAVAQETLRLWPPGTYLIRSPQDDDSINGYQVKKGEIVIIPTFAIQRLSKYWPNPEGFDPERFIRPLTAEQKILYIPFGAGPQACIGAQLALLQVTLILAMLAQRYRLTLTSGCSLTRDRGMVNRLNIDVTMDVHPL